MNKVDKSLLNVGIIHLILLILKTLSNKILKISQLIHILFYLIHPIKPNSSILMGKKTENDARVRRCYYCGKISTSQPTPNPHSSSTLVCATHHSTNLVILKGTNSMICFPHLSPSFLCLVYRYRKSLFSSF